MVDAVIVSTARTPIGKAYRGAFNDTTGATLGAHAIEHALKRSGIDGAEIVYQHFYDIGVAVSTDKGLMVPILRDADQMSFAAIEKAVAELAAKVRKSR